MKKVAAELTPDERDLKTIAQELKGKLQLLQEGSSRRRKLTPDELEDLLNVISYKAASRIVRPVVEERVRETMRKQLVRIEVEPEFVPHLRAVMAERFEGAIVPNRHPVGMIAAQALGENASQAGLRSFHHAGITGDTGFDRIKAVTDMTSVESSKNPFTSIALKGNPSRLEAEIYSHKIGETKIGDVCEMLIGRTRDDVPEMSTIFQQSPVFFAKPGGWQDTYVSLLQALGSDDDSNRGSFERPDWIIKMIFDTDKLFQRRISMATIAEAIERKRSELRVIISDIRTGEAEVYYTGKLQKGLPGDEPNQSFHSFLTHNLAPDLKATPIQGVAGFTKTIVETYNITTFVNETSFKAGVITVRFAAHDARLNGIPVEQIISLLAIKASVLEENVTHVGGYVFEIAVSKTSLKDFRARLTSPEVVTLEEAVSHPIFWGREYEPGVPLVEINNEPTKIHLRRDFLRRENDVSVEAIGEFFRKQNELPQFSAVDISFDRKTFEVTISYAADHTPENVYERSRLAQSIGGDVTFHSEGTGFYILIPKDTDLEPLEALKRDYLGALNVDVAPTGNGIMATIELVKTSHQDVWSSLVAFTTSCDRIFTTFVAEARERHAHRQRILARGVGTTALSRLHYVNIYATIPSVPWEIFNHFDIEASRAYTHSELVLNGGADVGNRHLSLVADTLHYVGYPIKMKKSGKEAMKAGVLATASFQETLGVMIDMSAGNVHDELKSSAGMTLKGDFTAGEAEVTKSRRSVEVDSAIELMMGSTVTMRRAKKILKVPKVTSSRTTTSQKSSILTDPEFAAPEGFL